MTCLRHRTEIHIGLVHESIAPDRKKKTIENRVSRLRSRLGVGSDGNDLLPESSSGRNGRSHYMVSPLDNIIPIAAPGGNLGTVVKGNAATGAS